MLCNRTPTNTNMGVFIGLRDLGFNNLLVASIAQRKTAVFSGNNSAKKSICVGGGTLTDIFLVKNSAEPASRRHAPAFILLPKKYEPATKPSPSLGFVWAPSLQELYTFPPHCGVKVLRCFQLSHLTRLFFLLKKYDSAVRVPTASRAVGSLPRHKIKSTRFCQCLFILCCNYTLCANFFRAETERMNQSRHRLAEPRRTPKKNVPCFSDLRATNFF